MMPFQQIKGPWKYEIENEVRYDSLTGEKREMKSYWIKQEDDSMAIICGTFFDKDAIGNLMAAAPEMLEVLELVRNAVEHSGDPDFSEISKVTYGKVIEAIAKAKGEYFAETPLIESEIQLEDVI